MRPMVDIIAKDAVGAMVDHIGAACDVQNVILVGGGAFLFKKVVKEAFATHHVLAVKDPMFANVRGYQIAGINYAMSVMANAPAQTEAAVEGEGA